MERLIVPVKDPTYKEEKWGLAAIYQVAPPKRTAPKLHLGFEMFGVSTTANSLCWTHLNYYLFTNYVNKSIQISWVVNKAH